VVYDNTAPLVAGIVDGSLAAVDKLGLISDAFAAVQSGLETVSYALGLLSGERCTTARFPI
jgi:hypothetical protein